jgi:hypothetical protein
VTAVGRYLVLVGVLAAGCGRESSGPTPTSAAAPRFELDCDSSDTTTKTELFCVRSDTRSGEVLRIDKDRLPASNGPTAAAVGPPGLYTTVCDATSTDTRSDFFCIRLNTDTGELMMINLQKVGVFPSGS